MTKQNEQVEDLVKEYIGGFTYEGKDPEFKYSKINRLTYARHYQPTEFLIDWLRTTLTKLITDTKKKRDEELIVWIKEKEVNVGGRKWIDSYDLKSHLKEKE